jgi:hypothetical protein
VTNELIELLLSEDPLGRLMRERCIINIVPMYNPDGVELGYGRENANGVDIESNWDKPVLEPEVQVLKGLFETFMAEPNPIRVALNMHSAWDCSRYFVYHAASGTSASYALLEQEYIGYVRAPFPSRIKPYNYFVSWNNSAPLRYPESWFWYNHGEAVMALTYEDMNCSAAGGFDTTAMALLQGTADYLGITGGPTGVTVTASAPHEFRLLQNYPNPFNPSTTIEYSLPRAAHATVKVYNLLGSEVATLVDEARPAGVHRLLWDAGNAPSGVYLYMIRAGDYIETRRAILIR